MVSISTEDAGEIAKGSVKWLSEQRFNNILLLSILVYMGVMTVYIIRYAIPAHLEMIQNGYEKLEEQQSTTINGLTQAFKEDREMKQRLLEELINKK